MSYLYTFNKLCDSARLQQEIEDSAIVTALDYITTVSPSTTNVYFKATLSSTDEDTLDTIVTDHVNEPLPQQPVGMHIVDNDGNKFNQLDNDGAMIVRTKMAKRGWTYAAIPIEVTTSTVGGSLYSKLVDGTDRAGITVKAYDANDAEVTTPGLLNANLATIVKLVVDFEPAYDYEVIGGTLRTESNITDDMRLWIIAVPDIAANQGGSKEMAGGISLKYLTPGNVYEVDGRVSKTLTYNATYHTSKIRLVFKHSAGVTENLCIVLEIYRP